MAKANIFEIALENLEDMDQYDNIDFLDPNQFDGLDQIGLDYEESNNINLLSQEIEQSLMLVGTFIDINNNIAESRPLDLTQANVVTAAVEALSNKIKIKDRLPALECYGKTMSRTQATKNLKVSIEGIIKDIWEKILLAFKKIGEYLKNLYNKIVSYIKTLISKTDDTVKKAEKLQSDVDHDKEPSATMESISLERGNFYELDRHVVVVAYSFGEYLGDDKKQIEDYIRNINNLDNSILSLLKECTYGLEAKPLDISKLSGEFTHISTPEQKEYFKDTLGVTPEKVQIIELPFNKGFIWHLTEEEHGVRAGIRRLNTVYRVYKLPALTIKEIKLYMQSLQRDMGQNSHEANKIAMQITNLINARIADIHRLASSGHTKDDEITKHRAVLNAAQVSLNSIKNIEFGFWQYKVQTLMKIKQYCDISIAQRSKDYAQFRKANV